FLEEFYQQGEADGRDVNDECRDAPWRVSTLLCDKMRQGECLVLLDGLDEVFNQTSRQQIVQQIEAFVTDYPDNKYVITSRIAGYRDVKLGSRFTQFTITQMEFEQVERFLRRWCLAIEKAQKPEETEEVWRRDAQKEAGELLEAIHGNEGVKRLTGNPLLLTILALIHRNGSRLPNRRVELYALAVKTLIEDWQLSKNLPDAPQVMLRESEVIELLAPLAYWMHEEKPSGLITQAEAEAQLGEKLAELNDEDAEADSVKKAVQKFLRRVRETTGLFVERAPNVYGFMHLTFEEYFVARYIADNDVSEILDIIQKHQDDARWQEPILLALGYLGIHSPKRVNRLLERLFKGLEDYQPVLGEGEIQVKNYSSSETILQWSVLAEDGTISWCESDSILQELLFAGQVVAEVEVNSRIRSKVIEKLVITLLQATDSENDTNESTEKIIKLLRQIDQFNKKDEVIEKLKPVANNLQLSNLMRALAQLVILYVYCGEPKVALINYLNNLVNQLNPLLFIGLKGMSTEFGEDITPVLETIRQSHKIDKGSQKALDFTIAISYIRPKKYKKAILILEKIVERFPPNIRCFIYWGLADSWEAEENYKDAIGYYKKAYRELSNYFQAEDIVALLHDIGNSYKKICQYPEAIYYYQQSLELYEHLDKQQDVANQWYWLAACYRDWGQYEKAIECEQKDLAIRQQLDDQSRIALAYYQLGRIYQDWGKYKEAITHHQQSRNLHQQIGHNERIARSYRYIGKTQRLLAQTTSDTTAALTLLSQAEDNIRQSRQSNTKNDYTKNQGY
ncbi:MAG: tetratricopeptide repeat protein, partial [Coleofasciculus sp. C2-GNP5-27]